MASMGPAGFSSYGGWVGAEHLLIPAEMLRRTPYTVSWEGSFSIGPGNPDQRPSPSSAAAATASSPSWAHSGGPSWAYSSGGGGGAGVSGRAVMPHGVTTRWGCAASSPPPHTCCVCSGLLSQAMCLRLLRGVTRRLRGYRELWEGASAALLAEGLQYDATQGQVRIRDFSRWSHLACPLAVPEVSGASIGAGGAGQNLERAAARLRSSGATSCLSCALYLRGLSSIMAVKNCATWQVHSEGAQNEGENGNPHKLYATEPQKRYPAGYR